MTGDGWRYAIPGVVREDGRIGTLVVCDGVRAIFVPMPADENQPLRGHDSRDSFYAAVLDEAWMARVFGWDGTP